MWKERKLSFQNGSIDINSDTSSTVDACAAELSDSIVCSSLEDLPESLRVQYEGLFNRKAGYDFLPEHRSCDLEIVLLPGTRLPTSRPYILSKDEMDLLKEEITKELASGRIVPSTAPCSAPVFFVPKANGGKRMVVDYRKLNAATVKDEYPLPLIHQVLDKVGGAKVFSKLDMPSAFQLLRIKEGDEWKTTFTSIFGNYMYLVMPFGVKNAPPAFQRFISDVLKEYNGVFVVVYIDDILVYSNSVAEHEQHLRLVFDALLKEKLYLVPEKCSFFQTEVPFLGYVLSDKGLAMDPAKVKSVVDWPVPKTLKEVQGFMGLANFCRKFIKDFAEVAGPMLHLSKNCVKFVWTPECQESFDTLKRKFVEYLVLHNPDPTKPYVVEADASNFAIGATILQEFEDGWHLVAYMSRRMTKAERNYVTYEQELLAIKEAFEEWRYLLVACTAKVPIIVRTDHKNLEHFQTSKTTNGRLLDWSAVFADYDIVITYKPGTFNVVPDALSRQPDHFPSDADISEKKSQFLF